MRRRHSASFSRHYSLVYQYELAPLELGEGVVLVAYHLHVNVRVRVRVALAVS